MKYRGYTITAEVTAYERFSLDEDGARDEYIESSMNSGDVTGYFLDHDTDEFKSVFVTMSETDAETLRHVIDMHIAELAA